jgi:uncharacterized protein (DUF1330 family)
MRPSFRLILSALACGLVVIFAAASLRAQQIKPLPAFLIAEIDVTDAVTYKSYADQVPATLAPFGGKYLVRGGNVQSLEGEPPKRIVVIAFENMEKARAWENSPAYEAIKPIRHASAHSRTFIVEGTLP